MTKLKFTLMLFVTLLITTSLPVEVNAKGTDSGMSGGKETKAWTPEMEEAARTKSKEEFATWFTNHVHATIAQANAYWEEWHRKFNNWVNGDNGN